MAVYLVDVDLEDGEDHNCYCITYEEAVACAKRYEGHYCAIYKLVARKNQYTGEITEEKDNE